MTRTAHPILVFADGACSGNPGPGGWGVIIATPDGKVVEMGGGEPETTNNRMELTAVGKALRFLEKTPGDLDICTDSAYVINGITKWIWGWRNGGWKTAEGKEVANAEFWRRLLALVTARKELGKIEWKYVRGHAGIPGNDRVDEIAVAFSKGRHIDLYRGPLLKYEVAIHDLPDDTSVPEPKKREAGEKKAPLSYLSYVNGVARRHATWRECEARVKGVPGAKFKKCMNEDEERALLESWGAKL